jgi:hypothetical protein
VAALERRGRVERWEQQEVRARLELLEQAAQTELPERMEGAEQRE